MNLTCCLFIAILLAERDSVVADVVSRLIEVDRTSAVEILAVEWEAAEEKSETTRSWRFGRTWRSKSPSDTAVGCATAAAIVAI